MGMPSLRRRIYLILEIGSEGNWLSRAFDIFLIGLILFSVVLVFLQSMPELAAYDGLIKQAEVFVVLVFTLEYLLRIWTAPECTKYGTGWRAYWNYVSSGMAIIDLAAILPFYLDPLTANNTVVFRLLRIVRLIRVLKLGRYHNSFAMLIRVISTRRGELIASLVLALCLVVIASTLMYAVEHDAQPEAFPSIPGTLWWGIVTMTTVGYGDVYPVTPLGKFLAGVSVLVSVGLFALPAGLLASGFSEELAQARAATRALQGKAKVCPHCARELPPELFSPPE
jgi:voltage-gated potassium channel